MTQVIFLSLVEIAVVKRNQRDQKREESKREKRQREEAIEALKFFVVLFLPPSSLTSLLIKLREKRAKEQRD